MFKMFKPTIFVVPVAWLAVLLFMAFDAARPIFLHAGVTLRYSWLVLIIQLVVTLLVVTPFWRCIWRLIPSLRRHVYPDLNGEWDVELKSNWPRIERMIEAAKRNMPAIDMRDGPEDTLPELATLHFRARIKQSWLTMSMDLWSPDGRGPIKESKGMLMQPFRGEDGRHGFAYFFEQENESARPGDERTFRGAARLVQTRDNPNILCGCMWTARMWERGMNTAGEIRFTRRP